MAEEGEEIFFSQISNIDYLDLDNTQEIEDLVLDIENDYDNVSTGSKKRPEPEVEDIPDFELSQVLDDYENKITGNEEKRFKSSITDGQLHDLTRKR